MTHSVASRGSIASVDAPMGQPPVFYKENSEAGKTLADGLDAQGLR